MGKNSSSAFSTVISDPGALGISPCRLSTRSWFSMAAKTGKNSSYVVTPDEEFVVTPRNSHRLDPFDHEGVRAHEKKKATAGKSP